MRNHQNTKRCLRHRPETGSARITVATADPFEKQLVSLRPEDRQGIDYVWSAFASATASQRQVMLQGILSLCCSSQLSYLSTAVQPLLGVDFTAILPHELCQQIFTHLDAQSLCAAAQVSRCWKAYADDDKLWHRMCEQHIDKKCGKCGWGLPLIRKRAWHSTAKKRPLPECEAMATGGSLPKRVDRKSWKSVYSERLVVERNWRSNKSCQVVLDGQHTDGVHALQFCDARNMLITGSLDKTAVVWDLSRGVAVRVLRGHARGISALQFDDTKLVTGSLDHTLKVWNYRTGQCVRTLEGHTDGVVHLHFDARILASGSADATIKTWNFQTGECHTLTGHTGRVNHVRIHHDSTSLFSSSDDGTIRRWDVDKRVCTHVFQGHQGPVQAAIPSMPGFLHPFHASSHTDQTNTKDGRGLHRSSAPVVISGSLDHTVKVWSLKTGECLYTLLGHTRSVWSLAYDKLRLVSGSDDGAVHLWDIESGKQLYSLHGHTSAVTAIGLSDTKIVSASSDGSIRLWDYRV